MSSMTSKQEIELSLIKPSISTSNVNTIQSQILEKTVSFQDSNPTKASKADFDLSVDLGMDFSIPGHMKAVNA